MRPLVLVDIKKKSKWIRNEDFSNRINLSFKKVIRIPLRSYFKKLLILFAVGSFVFGFCLAPTGTTFNTSIKAAQNDEQRKALEAQLSDLEQQIAQHEATIQQYKKQGTSLQSEIKKLENQIAKLNLQIKTINLNLIQIDQQISDTQNKIDDTQISMDQNKQNLSQILQTVYENDSSGLMEILLKNPKLSDFFGDVNNLISFQDNLRVTLEKITETKKVLMDQNEQLGLERADTASLKAYQDAQKATIQQTQQEKATLLAETKGKESEYQKIVAEKKKTAAEIRQQIYQLLGGGQMQFSDAYQLALMAEKATGVRAAFLLAILDRESALGKNVGQCDYKTAMHPTRDIPIFLQLVSELGLQSNLSEGLLKVSCANADGAYGGAMGPAQFIPSTWVLYADRVAALTGHNPASPWNNADAFMATALYLEDGGAANATVSQERIAAAKYYAGSRWRNYLWTYGDRVITQAQNFEDDIAVLNS